MCPNSIPFSDFDDPSPEDARDLDLPALEGQILGASRIGESHKEEGTPRQDAFAMATSSENGPPWWGLAVSDGVGHAENSHIGSHVAVTQLVESLQGQPDGAVPAHPQRALEGAVLSARVALLEEATRREIDPDSLCCTLLFLLCHPSEDGWETTTFQIGDGVICKASWEGDHEVIGKPWEGPQKSTEYLHSDTLLENWPDLVRSHRFEEIPDAFLLMSDGVAETYDPLTAYLDLLIESLTSAVSSDDPVKGVYRSICYDHPGSRDDRTLLLSTHRMPDEAADQTEDKSGSNGEGGLL